MSQIPDFETRLKEIVIEAIGTFAQFKDAVTETDASVKKTVAAIYVALEDAGVDLDELRPPAPLNLDDPHVALLVSAVREHERLLHSERTKAGIAAAKARREAAS